ncbi:MAG: hypothetical protein MUO99_08475 [Dehalococcoidales bacterium]|nr:hypothetical protein [Dehalococcoidales bacterium]
MIYTLHRYTEVEPFSGQYDIAWIAQDEDDDWQGWAGIWNLGIGDCRNYKKKVHSAELAFRFRNLDIPADAEILEAKILLQPSVDIDDVVNSKISVEDSIATISFPGTAVYANFVGRSCLGDTVEWNGTTEASLKYGQLWTADFSSLIQSLISIYGVMDKAAITVFCGDRDGNTPVPGAGEANWIEVGYPYYAILRIVYEVINVIPVPFPSVFYAFEGNQLSDAVYGIDDENIINDARVIIPHYDKELDYSLDPPAWTPVDFKVYNIDENSQNKYARRTRINKEVVGNWFHFASTYCEQTLKDCRDPVPSMTLRVLGADDEAIKKLLAIRIIDKLLVTVAEAGIDKRFWIDNKILTLETGYILATFNLREITSPANIPHIFRVGYDKIGDMEAVLG